MELKPGYKQTEVGVIPEEWEVIELGDLINYTKGFPFKSSEYQTIGIRIIRVSDTTYDSIKEEDPVFVSESRGFLYINWKLKEHDLVVSTVGSKPPLYDSMVGKAILIGKSHENTLLNQNAVLIRDRKRRPHIQWLLLNNLRTKRYLAHIEAIYRGNANQASITLHELFRFGIPLPTDNFEQRAIAEALSDVDALLAALDRLIAKQRDLKQATIQQLLTGQTRLPGFTGEWEVKPLRKACTLFNGRAYALHEWETSGVPVIRLQNLTGGDEYYYSTMQLPEQKYCNRGDLLYMWSATFGPHFWMGEKAIYHYHIWKVVPNDEVATREFLFYKLFEITDEKKTRSTNGGTMLHVTKSSMESTPLVLPPLAEQTAIAAVLTDMDAQLAALEQRRAKTRLLKQAMMQELLTGRTRLVE